MDNTIRQVAHDQCTGCGACLNKCPKNAIQMKPDKEGFLFPEITNACIECGACLKVCPVLQPDYSNNKEPLCRAVMASDEIREKSSSGGVFSLLAQWILEQDGIVCGAANSDDNYSVSHVIVTREDGLAPLRGSKYVQSDIGDVYSRIRVYLLAGKKVLFTGTPCQVAGLNSYLGKRYDSLYTLDLVCHGVPSPGLYRQFIQELESEYGSKAKRISFREKKLVGWDVSTTVEFEDGQVYAKKRNECPYMKSFLKLLTLRECCGQCPFAALPRQGDLTIADFWDVHRYKPELDDRKGTSMVLCNNEKGEIMLEVLKNKAMRFENAPLDHAIKYNAQIKYSSILHPHRKRFFDLLYTYHYNVKKAVDYGMNRRFDVGLVGWWYGANYGSALTSFALNRVLKSMGKTVLMLEWPIVSGDVPKSKPNTATRRFANHFYEQSMMYPISEYSRFNYHCDSFVVGSDQLWNWYSNRDVGTYHFFLDFVDANRRKIAYSTSFGHEYVYYPQEMRLKVGYYLSRFDAISVREKNAVEVCRRDFNVDAIQTMDPVFLCDQNSYDEAIALSKVSINEPYVLAYILNPTQEKIKAIRLVAEKMGLPYHIILDGQENFEKNKRIANDDRILEPVEIADWLKYIKNASYVVTDSFHGFCYSVVFKRNMSVFPNQLRGLDRFNSLAEMTDLTDRLVYSYHEFEEKKPWENEIDFNTVTKLMQPEIERSYLWLQNSLNQRKLPPNVKTLQYEEIDKLAKRKPECEEIDRLKKRESELERQINDLKAKCEPGKLKWLRRKIMGGIKCLRDNGFVYTAKRVEAKVKNRVRAWRNQA